MGGGRREEDRVQVIGGRRVRGKEGGQKGDRKKKEHDRQTGNGEPVFSELPPDQLSITLSPHKEALSKEILGSTMT
jgi:hypothetical protein